MGELWVCGTTVAQGYWNNPEATAATFGAHTAGGEGPFLRTGDLAFIHQGETYLTGRLKDVVIVRGQNHHPQDIEWTVAEAVDVLRPNCAAAFGVRIDDHERLVLVAEAYPDKLADPSAVFGAMRAAIFEDHGLQPASLLLLAPRALPKTSSGKIQRSLARARFLADDFEVLARWDAATPAPQVARPSGDLAGRLARLGPRQRHQTLVDALAARAAALLGLDPEDLEPDQPVKELGLDSVTAVELVESIGEALGQRVDGTALFDHPTLDALATFLLDQAAPPAAAGARQASKRSSPTLVPSDVASMTEEEAAAALLAELDDL